jgi:hypothetical protein
MKRLYIILLGLLLLVPLQGQILVHSSYSLPPSADPAETLLADGNTWAWYDYNQSITKDGSDLISIWADRLGSGHNLLQATGSIQPLWTSVGIDFDGVSDYLKTAEGVVNQPTNIYICFKQVTWTDIDYIFDGYISVGGQLSQRTTTPDVYISAGTPSSRVSPTLDTWCIIRVLFNGASSKLQLNADAAVTGNFGANHMDGMTLGNSSATGRASDIIVKEVIIRSVDDSDENETTIYNYLKAKYGL